jgi:uncharacterized cupin superfamily protein
LGPASNVEPHLHANEQIVWMLKGKMEFRLGTEQWVCGPGDVMVNPGGPQEHEAWFHKDTSGLNRTALIRIFDTNLAKGATSGFGR